MSGAKNSEFDRWTRSKARSQAAKRTLSPDLGEVAEEQSEDFQDEEPGEGGESSGDEGSSSSVPPAAKRPCSRPRPRASSMSEMAHSSLTDGDELGGRSRRQVNVTAFAEPIEDSVQDPASAPPSPELARSSAGPKPTRVVIFIRSDVEGQKFELKLSAFLGIPFDPRHDKIQPSRWARTLPALLRSQPELRDFVEDGVAVHQSLVTALHIFEHAQKAGSGFEVEIRKWKPGAMRELCREVHLASRGRLRNLAGGGGGAAGAGTLALVLDTSMCDAATTPQPWDELDEGPAAPGLRCYPARPEMEGDNGKIDDISALDQAAAAADPPAWRPTSCFGFHGRFGAELGPCALLGHARTVYKRSWSAFSEHVRVLDQRQLPLTCLPLPPPAVGAAAAAAAGGEGHAATGPDQVAAAGAAGRRRTGGRRDVGGEAQTGEASTPASASASAASASVAAAAAADAARRFAKSDYTIDLLARRRRARWFHQALVPSLLNGEYRVFIATRASATGRRGRAGYVVHWIHTATRRDVADCRGLMAATQPDAEDPDGGHDWGGTSAAAVAEFALATFEALRARADAGFASLEVGCRIDVGVVTPAGTLFVNEVTRWYAATYFSDDCLPCPKTRICSRYARAFAEWMGSGGPAEVWDRGRDGG